MHNLMSKYITISSELFDSNRDLFYLGLNEAR